jgi:hypothetical protein
MIKRDRAVEICGGLRHVKTCVDELLEVSDGSDRSTIVANSITEIANQADELLGQLSNDALRLLDAVSMLEGIQMEYSIAKRIAEVADDMRETLGNPRLIQAT